MKVILSSHLPGVIDILIPIALPFRNVVELAGDLQTTMKSIEERDWLAQGYYLSLSDKTWKCYDRDRVLFVQNNKLPDIACKKIGIKRLSDLLYDKFLDKRGLDITTVDNPMTIESLSKKEYHIGKYNLKNADIMRDYRSDISRAEFETRSITDKLIITIILKVIDKHGVDKFFVG